jgi:hypothetical protein
MIVKREKYTEKLIRMIEVGGLPAKVQALYVFGSYARGACEPGDLDVIAIYEWPSRATFDAWVRKGTAAGECHYDAVHHVAGCRTLGKESIKALPYAMLWFQMHRQQCAVPQRTEIWSRSQTHRVEIGRPSLAWMLRVFQLHDKVRRQCLIPHLKKAGPNALLIFERGPNWTTDAASPL